MRVRLITTHVARLALHLDVQVDVVVSNVGAVPHFGGGLTDDICMFEGDNRKRWYAGESCYAGAPRS